MEKQVQLIRVFFPSIDIYYPEYIKYCIEFQNQTKFNLSNLHSTLNFFKRQTRKLNHKKNRGKTGIIISKAFKAERISMNFI